MTTTASFARHDCLSLDASDPLSSLRDLFHVPPGVYLCGNSLGLMPTAAVAEVTSVLVDEWSPHAVGGWDAFGWRDRPRHLGDRLGKLIGAGEDQTLVVDTTAINLYKVVHCAAAMAGPQRRVVITERENFPADLFITDSVARQQGLQVWAVLAEELDVKIAEAGERLGALVLSDVNYRDGSRHDMHALTRRTHDVGGLAVWDLAHSAGAVDVDLLGCGADFAVGCGYKYLNGGPGAPAFVWAHPRHAETLAEPGGPSQPLWGWLGHAHPFDFTTHYVPSSGANHFLCSSPSQLGVAALSAGLGTHEAARSLVGADAVWAKSAALTSLFADLVSDRLGDGVSVVTPHDPARRGSQVSLRCVGELAGAEKAIIGALKNVGVVGDFRVGERRAEWQTADYMRFGFAPLYVRYVDVYDAVDAMVGVIESGVWR